jgi:hypothetical protein
MLSMGPRRIYASNSGYKIKTETYDSFHADPDIPKFKYDGFHENCEGCPHVVENIIKNPGAVKSCYDRSPTGSKKCVYVVQPRMRKFPCFFKENVPAGGFDGQYGKSVNNYIKATEHETLITKTGKGIGRVVKAVKVT